MKYITINTNVKNCYYECPFYVSGGSSDPAMCGHPFFNHIADSYAGMIVYNREQPGIPEVCPLRKESVTHNITLDKSQEIPCEHKNTRYWHDPSDNNTGGPECMDCGADL